MEELARAEPADHPAQIARLLAIRWLGEHGVTASRGTLERIAAGQAGQDRLGFARDYARRSLARLDRQPPRRAPTAENSLREALRWFPDTATSVEALDMSVSWANQPFALGRLVEQIPPDQPGAPFALRPTLLTAAREPDYYPEVEQIGNVRIDRFALATLPPARQGGKGCALIRLTGRGDHGALVDYFHREHGLPLIGWEARHDDVPITLLGKAGVAMALIGDTDLVAAINLDEPGDNFPAVEQMLALRSGQGGDVFHGPFAAELRELPGNDSGLVIGELPGDCKLTLAKAYELPAEPRRIALHAVVDESASIDLQFRCFLRTPEDARAFAATVLGQRERQVDDLRRLGSSPSIDVLVRTLNSIRMETEGSTVSGSARVSGDVPAALGEVPLLALGQYLGQSLASAFAFLGIVLLGSLTAAAGLAGALVFIVLRGRASRARRSA